MIHKGRYAQSLHSITRGRATHSRDLNRAGDTFNAGGDPGPPPTRSIIAGYSDGGRLFRDWATR